MKKSGRLWQYYRDKPFLDDNDVIACFIADNNDNELFKFQAKIVGYIENGNTKDVKIMVPLKYLSNFWRTLEWKLIVKIILF